MKNNKEAIALSSILDTLASKRKEHLKTFLSDHENEMLSQSPTAHAEYFTQDESSSLRLSQVHYSWFIPFIEPFCDTDKALILCAFNKDDRAKLMDHFKLDDAGLTITSVPEQFLHETLISWITSEDRHYVPKRALIEDPLLCLIPLSKKQIIEVVNLLAMHDVSIELKHVISSSLLSKISLHLSTAQKDYLNQIIEVKEPINFPKLQLEKWEGDKESLRTILYHRGFNRLGKALYGSQKALFWHVAHKIDTGRAKVLEKFYSDITNDQIHKHLINQVVSIAKKVSG